MGGTGEVLQLLQSYRFKNKKKKTKPTTMKTNITSCNWSCLGAKEKSRFGVYGTSLKRHRKWSKFKCLFLFPCDRLFSGLVPKYNYQYFRGEFFLSYWEDFNFLFFLLLKIRSDLQIGLQNLADIFFSCAL